MVKILIENASILAVGKEPSYIRNGYIYIENGTIKSLGQGPVPEGLPYPELLLSGSGRLVSRGFASGFTVLSLYPMRYGLNDVDWYLMREMLRSLKRVDMYYISILSLAELASRGVTEALVVDAYLDEVARASRDVGIGVTVAPPLNCGLDDQQQLHELRLLLGRWHGRAEGVKVAIAVCRELREEYLKLARDTGLPLYAIELEKEVSELPEGVTVVAINPLVDSPLPAIYYGKMLKKWRRGCGVGIGVRSSYSIREVLKELLWTLNPDPLDVLLAGTGTTSGLINHGESLSISEGSRSSLVMYNLSEPPGWPPPHGLYSATRAVIEGDLPIETMIFGDDIVLDRDGMLTVGHEAFKKAIKKYEEFYSTLPPLFSRLLL